MCNIAGKISMLIWIFTVIPLHKRYGQWGKSVKMKSRACVKMPGFMHCL